MFRPVPMDRVEILLLQRDLDEVANGLAEAGILHLRTLEGPESAPPGDPEEASRQLNDCRKMEARLRELLQELAVPAEGAELTVPVDTGRWHRETDRIAGSLERVRKRLAEMHAHLACLEALHDLLREVADLEVDYADLVSLERLALRVGRLPTAEIAGLQKDLPPLSCHVLERSPSGCLAAILAAGEAREELDRHLAEHHFTPMNLPRRVRGSCFQVRMRVVRLRDRTRLHIRRLEARISALQEKNQDRLQTWLRSVVARRQLLEIRKRFGYTERTAALGGWVPADRVSSLEKALKETCGERHVLLRRPAAGDDTPVEVANPRLLKPFQKILAVYGTPSYGELEPTPLLGIGFVLLFGMMFGDVGHGLVLAAAGWILRRAGRFREEGLILVEVGVSAALFGVLFGSYFGNEELLPPLWFSPMHNVPLLMGAALGLGIALILTGLTLRIFNEWRPGSRLGVLTDRYGVAGLVFYAGAVVSAFFVWRGALPGAALLWLLAPLGAIFLHPFCEREEGQEFSPLLAASEGFVEVLETVLGYLANTFSFLRVAAFGLAHVGLCLAVFALAERAAGLPLGDVWVVLVHLFGNVVILVLEGLVVSIQTVRLEFYEFFSKFFRGGGVPYRPLSLQPRLERGG